MGFLDDVKGFTSGVAEKTKGNMDVISLNQQITSAEKDLKEMYTLLGEKYYEQHGNDPEQFQAGFPHSGRLCGVAHDAHSSA